MRHSPLVTTEQVFVWSEHGGLVCLGAAEGEIRWTQARVVRLAAVSPMRAYGFDPFGRLIAIDARSGVVEGALAIGEAELDLVNRQTDRIFLGSANGLIQCLREMDLEEPVEHLPPTPSPTEADKTPEDALPAGERAKVGEEPMVEEPLSEEPTRDEPAEEPRLPPEGNEGDLPEPEPASESRPAEAPPGQEPAAPDPFGDAGAFP
jgi:hypothetical protein